MKNPVIIFLTIIYSTLIEDNGKFLRSPPSTHPQFYSYSAREVSDIKEITYSMFLFPFSFLSDVHCTRTFFPHFFQPFSFFFFFFFPFTSVIVTLALRCRHTRMRSDIPACGLCNASSTQRRFANEGRRLRLGEAHLIAIRLYVTIIVYNMC